MKIQFLNFVTITLFFCFCSNPKQSDDIAKIVGEWTGKEINFPTGVPCFSNNKDTACIPPESTPYKILIYTDSTGCTSCKLHLYKWNTLIKEAEEELKGLSIFSSTFSLKNEKELRFLLKRDAFIYSAYMDSENLISKLNTLPSDPRFQTFLLDEENKVILIGNPTNNPKVWEL